MQNLQVLGFIRALVLFLTSHHFSRWHSSLCANMCTWRSLCQNLPFSRIPASMACLGGFSEGWGGREMATLSLKDKITAGFRHWSSFGATENPIQSPSKGKLYKLNLLTHRPHCPWDFCPTHNNKSVYKAPASCSSFSTCCSDNKPLQLQGCPLPLIPAPDRSQQDKVLPTPKHLPLLLPQHLWHLWLLGSRRAPRGPSRGASTFCLPDAGNLWQRGSQQLGWESCCCCCLPSLHARHKKKILPGFSWSKS